MGKGALEDLVASPTFRMCQCVCSCACVEEVRGGKSITSWVHAGKAITGHIAGNSLSPPFGYLLLAQLVCVCVWLPPLPPLDCNSSYYV